MRRIGLSPGSSLESRRYVPMVRGNVALHALAPLGVRGTDACQTVGSVAGQATLTHKYRVGNSRGSAGPGSGSRLDLANR